MKVALSPPIMNYVKRINGNFSYPEKIRLYALAWFFDHLAQGKTPHEAYDEVMACLELLRSREVSA